MSDMVTNDQTILAYDDGVEAYAAEMRNEIDMPLLEWMGRALDGLNTNARILEVGSGTGRDADYIESLGYHVQRTDASQGFIDYLRARNKNVEPLNILTDTLSDNYDLVHANAVFLHFTEPEFTSVLRKINAALNHGGRLSFSLKQGDGEETTNRKLDAPRYFHFWQPDAVRALLSGAGFTDIEISVGDDWRPDRPGWLFITAVKGVSNE